MTRIRKHANTTNPSGLANPYNHEPRIHLLNKEGEFLEMVSQIYAFQLLRSEFAELVMDSKPTIRLNVLREEIGKKVFSRKYAAKYLHARRSVLYGGYHIQNRQGELMFICNNQRALWYINRGLLDVISQEPPTFRLKFEPGGPGHASSDDLFYTTPKENLCCVCGQREGLNRHHVVPSFYRRYMGLDIKSRSHYDVLPLCLTCHEKYERFADKLKMEIAKEYDSPLHARYKNGELYESNRGRDRAIRNSVAIVNHGSRIPAQRHVFLREQISEYLQHEVTDEEINELSKARIGLDKKSEVKDLLCHGHMVVSKLPDLDALQKFVERWRGHFLDNMQPKFMPEHWNVSHSILPVDYKEGDPISLKCTLQPD